jgi:glycosyl transferase family 87
MRLFPADMPAESRVTLRDCALLGGLASLGLVIVYVATARWLPPYPRDASSLVIGRDFLNFWMYGRAALEHAPERFYDPGLYNAALRKFLGPDYLGQNWSYPPDIMLLAAPFGLLGYLPALVSWTLIGIATLAAAGFARLRDKTLILPLFAAPAVAFCLMSGQSSLLTAAALVTAFAWLDRRPILAGVLMGLLTLKPQLGLLLPVMLIASARWRVFGAAAATAAVLVSVSASIFGMNAWLAYLHQGLAVQNGVLADTRLIAAPFMPTVFMNLHAVGLGYGAAMAVQACVSLLAAATVFWAFRVNREANPQALQALFFACSLAATPYLLSYDTLPLVFASMMLLRVDPLDTTGRTLVKLAFWLPFLQFILGKYHVPGAAFVAPAFAAWLAWRLTKSAKQLHNLSWPATASHPGDARL